VSHIVYASKHVWYSVYCSYMASIRLAAVTVMAAVSYPCDYHQQNRVANNNNNGSKNNSDNETKMIIFR
jgi:hypothetical protein